MLDHRLRVYLAGPDVFYEDAEDIIAQKRRACVEFGYTPHAPIDTEVNLFENEASHKIFTNNVRLIDSCDVVVANLSPFRGPSADPGTVWEVGYAFAKGKKIIGYSNTTAQYIDRVDQYFHACGDDKCTVEDFLLSDNLMIHYALDKFIKDDELPEIEIFKKALKCL